MINHISAALIGKVFRLGSKLLPKAQTQGESSRPTLQIRNTQSNLRQIEILAYGPRLEGVIDSLLANSLLASENRAWYQAQAYGLMCLGNLKPAGDPSVVPEGYAKKTKIAITLDRATSLRRVAELATHPADKKLFELMALANEISAEIYRGRDLSAKGHDQEAIEVLKSAFQRRAMLETQKKEVLQLLQKMNFSLMQESHSTEVIEKGYSKKRLNDALIWLAKYSALENYSPDPVWQSPSNNKCLRKSLMEHGLKLAKEGNYSSAYEHLQEASKMNLPLEHFQDIKLQRMLAGCLSEQATSCTDPKLKAQLLEASAQKLNHLIRQEAGSPAISTIYADLVQVLIQQYNLEQLRHNPAGVQKLQEKILQHIELTVQNSSNSEEKAKVLLVLGKWQKANEQIELSQKSFQKAKEILNASDFGGAQALRAKIEAELNDLPSPSSNPTKAPTQTLLPEGLSTKLTEPWTNQDSEKVFQVFPVDSQYYNDFEDDALRELGL